MNAYYFEQDYKFIYPFFPERSLGKTPSLEKVFPNNSLELTYT